MAKAKNKEIYSGDDVKRYVGAVKEHFDDAVKVFKEGFSTLDKGLSEVKQDLKKVHIRLDGHERILQSHTEMIGKIMTQLEEVKDGLRTKVDYTDFAKLEKRVVYLETRLARA